MVSGGQFEQQILAMNFTDHFLVFPNYEYSFEFATRVEYYEQLQSYEVAILATVMLVFWLLLVFLISQPHSVHEVKVFVQIDYRLFALHAQEYEPFGDLSIQFLIEM